jgi:hypothetical protein
MMTMMTTILQNSASLTGASSQKYAGANLLIIHTGSVYVELIS